MNQDEQKRASARAALAYVDAGAILGVGTGSTVNALIKLMGETGPRPKAAVSSSVASSAALQSIGVPVIELNDAGPIDVYIDGADECDPHFRLIKGGGAALTREKIIAEASAKFICLIDDSKRVPYLGRFPLPIEVIPMARSLVARRLAGMLGAQGSIRWRMQADKAVVTDNGNWILDVADLQITDPLALERLINQIPGVVAVGLFALRPADVVISAGQILTAK